MSRLRPTPHHGTPRTSKLTPEQEAEAAELRLAFVLEIGRCEICWYDAEWERLCVHEIVRANMRKWVKTNRSLTLVVCDPCHRRLEREAWSVTKQAAYLYRSRPLDFRISELCRWSIKRIARADVMAIVRELETKE